MLYHASYAAIVVFLFFTGAVLALSFYLAHRARSAHGYFAAHGGVHWSVNGIAFAGDYLSAANFLGICGLIAFYGYDGFLYSIGYLAGWVVALFVIAEPIRRLGKYTFADALDARFGSRGIKLAAAISTLIVSIFYLIPQMVGAGALVKPLLGLEHYQGVLLVGVVVTLIVVTAGMVSTTYVQFIKGALLVIFCGGLTLMLLARGLKAKPADEFPRILNETQFAALVKSLPEGTTELPPADGWKGQEFRRFRLPDGRLSVWKFVHQKSGQLNWPSEFLECQVITTGGGQTLVNGLPRSASNDIRPVSFIAALQPQKTLPPEGPPALTPQPVLQTGPLDPVAYVRAVSDAVIARNGTQKITEAEGRVSTVYYPDRINGEELMAPGIHPTLFKGVKSNNWRDQLNFISLMLALFCGTASLPHILIRYYTVKDADAARKSTVVGIFAIGLFYVLTLYLGLGAMTSQCLDPTDTNMAAPLLARTFGQWPFAIVSAIAFTTVLGTVSGLILAAAGAVAHDLMENVLELKITEAGKVRAGKIVTIVVGLLAVGLGILFKNVNVSFLVGWTFNVAASANLPALIMLLFWPRTTRQGITAGILVGALASLAWILLSADALQLYGYSAPAAAQHTIVPFNQPALATIPLGFLVIVVVSLLTSANAKQIAASKTEPRP